MIAFVVGSHINHEVHNDFTYVGRPFLMGTIALGGVPFVMPYAFTKVKYVEHQVMHESFVTRRREKGVSYILQIQLLVVHCTYKCFLWLLST